MTTAQVGPWTKYQAVGQVGPWTKYQAAPAAAPVASKQGQTAQSAIDAGPQFNAMSLPAGANPETDQWTGGQDELGNKVYKTMTGTLYVIDKAMPQRLPGQEAGMSKFDAMSQDGVIPGIGNAIKYEAGNLLDTAKAGIQAPANPAATVGDVLSTSMFAMPSSVGRPVTAEAAGVAKLAPKVEPPVAAATPQADLHATIRTAVSGGRGAYEAQKKLAIMAKADPAVAAAADKLGVDLPPDMAVSDAQLAEQFRLMRSQPGSTAETAYNATKNDVAAKADAAIAELGGVADVAHISEKVRSELDATQAALKAKASALYDLVGSRIGPRTKVVATNLAGTLRETVKDLGGVKGMTPEERRLLSLVARETVDVPKPLALPAPVRMLPPPREGDLQGVYGRVAAPRQVEPPPPAPPVPPETVTRLKPITYGLLDRTRQDIGAALRRKASPYSNVSEAILKRLYASLSKDQLAAAEGVGAGDVLKSAQATTAQKKGLETSIVSAFGRDLNGSVATQIRSSIAAGTRGDIGGLTRLLAIVPKKLHREVVATGIADAARSRSAISVAAGGDLSRGFSADNFLKMYAGLKTNAPVYAEVMRALGPGAAPALDAIATVAKRVVESAPIQTGKALGKLDYLTTDSLIKGVLQSSVVRATRRASAVIGGGVMGGPVGAAVGAGLDDFLTKTKPDMKAAAAKLFASEEFKRLVQTAGQEKPQAPTLLARQIKAVADSAAFKAWARMSGVADGQKWLLATIEAARVQTNEGSK